jgi:hypothetical protein
VTILNDQQKRSIDHARLALRETIAERHLDDDTMRLSLFLAIRLIVDTIDAFDARNVDILDDINDDLAPARLKMSRLPKH